MSLIPNTSDILTDLQDLYQDTFGASLSLDPSTPAGLLIGIDTANLVDVNEQAVMLYSQFNIDTATGKYLDALCSIFNIARLSATNSYATVTFSGVENTLVPLGSIVENANKQKFATVEIGYVSALGNIDLQVKSVETGVIPVNANSLTELATPSVGITSVNNRTTGKVGTVIESDSALRIRFFQQRGKNGTGSLENVQAQVYTVEGVQKVKVIENFTDTVQVINGVSVDAHSINTIVVGGTVEGVATTIQRSKSGGCGVQGALSYDVPVGNTLYTIKFDRPKFIDTTIYIELKNTGYSGDIVTDLKLLVQDYFQNTLQIGQTISPTEIISEVACSLSGVFFTSIKISNGGNPPSSDPIEAEGNELGLASSVNVVVL